jgi:hypothetical protein
MNKLTLNDILRYVAIGYVISAVMYYCERSWVVELFTVLGVAGFTVAAFVLGSLVYLIYRPLIYNLILFFIVDRLYSLSIRRTLMQRYTVASHFEADALWKTLQNNSRIKAQLPPIELGSSGIHFLYMTAVVTFLGAIYITFGTGFTTPVWVMLLVALACATAAVTSDIFVEKQVKLLFTMMGQQSVEKVVTEAGYAKRPV